MQNKTEIRHSESSNQTGTTVCNYFLFALRRSGCHAIKNWLEPQFTDSFGYINDAWENGISSLINPRPVTNRDKKVIESWKHSRKIGFCVRSNKIGHNIPFSSTNNLFILENAPIGSASKVLEFSRVYCSQPAKNIAVLLVRDVRNHLASLLQFKRTKRSRVAENIMNLQQFQELYLGYSKEFLGITTQLRQFDGCIKVFFDKWFEDIGYRKQIADELSLKFSDAGLNIVEKAGGGSSFDLTKLNGAAQKMKVCDRHLGFVEDPQFLQLCSKELLSFSEAVRISILAQSSGCPG